MAISQLAAAHVGSARPVISSVQIQRALQEAGLVTSSTPDRASLVVAQRVRALIDDGMRLGQALGILMQEVPREERRYTALEGLLQGWRP